MLNLGITTRCFAGLSVSDTIRVITENRFRCAELCFVHPDLPGWTYNGNGPLDGITPDKVRQTAAAFRDSGVDVPALGMFTDLRNPDPAAWEETLTGIRRYIEYAAAADIPYLASECGFTPGRRGLHADTYEADYQTLKEHLRTVCLEAEQAGVHLALEACLLDIIPSPRRLKILIEELEAESHIRLGALLDPANFIANSDEEGMFYYLKHDIAYVHAKDRKMNAAYGCAFGDGDVDWVKFMECYIRFADKKPVILEYSNQDTCAQARQRAEDCYDDAIETLLSRIS